MVITVRGKRWKLLFEHIRRSADYAGKCDAPSKRSKAIRIHRGLKGERRLEVLIHEMLHAGHWDLAEEAVGEMAVDFARVLTRLGYACNGEK